MASAPHPTPDLVDLTPATTAVIAGVVPMAEIADFFDRSFGALAPAIAAQDVAVLGPAFARYHGQPTYTVDLEVGFPTDRPVTTDGDVHASDLPGGRVATLVHHGAFDQLGESWGRLAAWIAEQGHVPTADIWEVYVTEPSPDMDPADLVTELYWSLA